MTLAIYGRIYRPPSLIPLVYRSEVDVGRLGTHMAENDHRSPLRDIVESAPGVTLTDFATLRECQADSQGVVILEGDWGGQIYLVVPARQVVCSEETLRQLLFDIDAHAWPDNEPESSARLCYERREVGEGIAGGMGGGVVRERLWVHPELSSIADAIAQVLGGNRNRLVS